MMHLAKKNISFLLAFLIMLSLTTPVSAQDMGKVGQGNVVSVGGTQAAIIDESGSLWMRGYGIASTETLQLTARVEATDKQKAEQIVSDDWKKKEFILGPECFAGVEFEAMPTVNAVPEE